MATPSNTEERIIDALCAHAKTVLDQLDLPVQWPLKKLDPQGADHARVYVLPATTTNMSASTRSSDTHRGILQVSLFKQPSKISEQGLQDLLTPAGVVKSHFKVGTSLLSGGVKVRIISPPTVGGPIVETEWVSVPVSIPYISHVQETRG